MSLEGSSYRESIVPKLQRLVPTGLVAKVVFATVIWPKHGRLNPVGEPIFFLGLVFVVLHSLYI